jgi:hypothetical protein
MKFESTKLGGGRTAAIVLAFVAACLSMFPVAVTAQSDSQPPTISPIADITIDEHPSLAQLVPVAFVVDDPDDPASGWTVLSSFSPTVADVAGWANEG